VVVELLIFGTLIVFRPGHTKSSDALALFLSIVRVATTAALVPFVKDQIGVDPIPRVVVGIVIAIICSVGVIVLFVNFLVNLAVWRSIFRRKRMQQQDEDEVVDSKTASNNNLVDVEKAEAKEAEIKTRSPSSEGEPEPPVTPSIIVTRPSTSDPASMPKGEITKTTSTNDLA
jgi:low affinity Fe/Cu permease